MKTARTIDPEAETIAELSANTPGRSIIWMQKFANEQVSNGRWERVWKKQGIKYVPAYRSKN